MAAGALHLDTEEGGADDGAFRGHRHVVLRSCAKASRSAETLTAFLAQQFGDEEIHRLVVPERLVEPPAEGPGIVECGVQDVWILTA